MGLLPAFALKSDSSSCFSISRNFGRDDHIRHLHLGFPFARAAGGWSVAVGEVRAK